MDEEETEFLKTLKRTALVWFRYIDIFFIWTHGKEHLEKFSQELNNFNPYLTLTYELNEKEILFLKVKLNEGKISTDPYIRFRDRHEYLQYILHHHIVVILRGQVYSYGLQVKRVCSEEEDFFEAYGRDEVMVL